MTDKVVQYINEHWDCTVRSNKEDQGTLIGLPYSYTVPCMKGAFQELYYWDTYFACRGLAISGHREMVRNNIENFFYEVERFGFIPNGSRFFYLNRSQPAFLGALVKLMLELFPDDQEFKAKAVTALKREITFWDSHRRDNVTGLYHYGSDPSEEEIEEFFNVAVIRCGVSEGITDKELRRKIGLATLAEAESGWDFTTRFAGNCPDCAAIDLNSLLYLSMTVLAQLCSETGGDDSYWLHRAEELCAAVRKYCRRSDNVFVDYNYRTGRQVGMLTAASMFPLWAGFADAAEAEAARTACCTVLEQQFGVATTEKCAALAGLQWEYPNGWPCLQMICFEALDRYGFNADARRIAAKYVDTVRNNFELSGDLWEKYNVTDGSTAVSGEYEMPAMLGWTAGTYLAATELLAR